MEPVVEKGIHPTAVISENVKIGKNVSIGAYSIIGNNVEIGDNVKIGHHVYIERNTKIGNNVKIFPFAVLGTDPQDLKYRGEETYLEIGDNTIIREFVTINRGTSENIKTIIGKNCLLLEYVHIAHDCVLGDYVIMSNNATLAGHCKVGDHATLSGFVIVHQFSKIGAYSFIQGGSKVNKDIPPFALAADDPLVFHHINIEKLRRLNFSKEDIHFISKLYDELYVDLKVPLRKAAEIIKEKYKNNKYAQLISDFILSSERGVIRYIKEFK